MLRGLGRPMLSLAALELLSLCALGADGQVTIRPRQTALAAKRAVPATLRVDTSLVLIPVSVTDLLNHPITGLDKSDFRVFDSNIEQQVLSLRSEEALLAVGLVLDCSCIHG